MARVEAAPSSKVSGAEFRLVTTGIAVPRIDGRLIWPRKKPVQPSCTIASDVVFYPREVVDHSPTKKELSEQRAREKKRSNPRKKRKIWQSKVAKVAKKQQGC